MTGVVTKFGENSCTMCVIHYKVWVFGISILALY